MCWNVSLPVKTLKTTCYFSTPVFKDQLFQHSLSLNPCHSQAFLLHVSEDLHFHPLGQETLIWVQPWWRQGWWGLITLIIFTVSFFFILLLLLFLAVLHGTWDLTAQVRDNSHLLHWKNGVLTNRLPGMLCYYFRRKVSID